MLQHFSLALREVRKLHRKRLLRNQILCFTNNHKVPFLQGDKSRAHLITGDRFTDKAIDTCRHDSLNSCPIISH